MPTATNPFPYFPEAGTGGYIYVGAANQDAQANPITVYRDAALTIPWAQPIRTVDGYPAYQGAKAKIYTDAAAWSITVQNDNRETVTRDNNVIRLNSSDVSFLQSGTGAVSRTVEAKLRETVSVKDFGAVGNGVTNDAPALQSILNTASDINAQFNTTCAITSGLTLTGDNVRIDGLELKPVTTRSGLTALTIGNTAADASTTLAATANEYATTVTVTSATGFAAGKLVVFSFNNPTWVAADPLAADYQFVTRIVSVNGSIIELQDSLPQTINSAWTHSVAAWTPVRGLRLNLEIDQSAHGQKRTVTAITRANPAVLTVTGHSYTNGDTVTINGPLSGMTQIHGVTLPITVIDANTFSIPVNSTAFTAYSGGATVRQTGIGLRLGCVDSPDINLLAYDNDGLGSALQIDICYNPKIVARVRNCGSENNADVQATCWTGGNIQIWSDDPAGFGPTIMGGHYGVCNIYGASRAEMGRGVKTGKTRFTTFHIGPVSNPAFTAVGLTWVTQDCAIYCNGAIGSVRSAIQPVGFWTSQCYNTGNKVFGLFARGSTSLDVQVNSTDSVEFYGATIGNLDVPTGGICTLIGGPAPSAITGAGTIRRIQDSAITVSGANVAKLTDTVNGYPLLLYGSGANAFAVGADASGNGSFFTDREQLRLIRGAPTSGQTAAFLTYHNGTSVVFQQVTLGAADSGGTGFKTLRVPN